MAMGKNRIWYALLWVALILFWLVPTGRLDWELLTVIHRRWTWAIFLSPAADTFFAEMFGSIFLPIRFLSYLPAFFDPAHEVRCGRPQPPTTFHKRNTVVGE
jgi:hypothetical protein